MKLILSALLIVASSVAVAAAQTPSPTTAAATGCYVKLIEEIDVPAQEAGVLLRVDVLEGAEVQAGFQVAQIDDRLTVESLNAAKAKLAVARKQAENDTNIEYARAAAKVALSEYNRALEANRKIPGTVPPAEVERLKLTYDKSNWEIQQALVNKEIAQLELNVAEAEVNAADESLKRRKIHARLTAKVAELYRQQGEWVQPGDPVMRLVRTDRLYVEGALNANNVHQNQVRRQPVVVRVKLAGNQTFDFPGRVVFADDEVRSGGAYKVRAQIENRKAGGDWLLTPGLPAAMTIQLKPLAGS